MSSSTGRRSAARNRAGKTSIISSGRRTGPTPKDKQDVVQGACVWGTICNASAGMGRVVTEGYGDSPWAIFVRPDSGIRKPEDLKDVPVSVGMRAGSHFNVPYRLEKYLPLDHIKTVNTGGFGARLKALLDGEVEAASLLPPQIAMAEQLGLRKIIEDRFQTLWWVPENSPPEVVHGYMRALDRAEQALRGGSREISAAVEARSSGGIRELPPLGLQQIRPRRALRQQAAAEARSSTKCSHQVERWGLDQYLKDKNPDTLSYTA